MAAPFPALATNTLPLLAAVEQHFAVCVESPGTASGYLRVIQSSSNGRNHINLHEKDLLPSV